MILYEEVERIKTRGYNEANATSKLGQDVILKAISDSGMAKNVTIKGGVVMSSISGDSRRATQDFDLDFIRYSLSDDSIREFVDKLNCIESLEIKLEGEIIELKHQDYKGKRIFISLTDVDGTVISLKLDIGVHKDLSVEQEVYVFDLGFQKDTVSLLINSPAQMITEKLKSLVRFGTRDTRYKDIFDICYLSERVNMDQLIDCIQKFIIADDSLRSVSSMEELVQRIERVLSNANYINELEKSNKNWLDISVDEAIKRSLAFVQQLNP